jgi:membrane associated rhomboid family serine protease
MLPISDVIPSRTAPIVTVVLIAVNLLVFLYERSLADAQLQLFIGQYALIPAWFAWPALFSSQFLHAGWAHVLSNMLYLWIFGDNVEDRLGHGKFLVFYLFAGAAAAILQMVFNPFSAVPMVGASGAISGVMGAYFVMYPHSRVLTLVFFFLVEVPAIFFLGIYFVMQVLSGVGSLAASNAAGGGTAFWAHVGGFIFGAMMGAVLRARGSRRWEHDDAWLNERRY